MNFAAFSIDEHGDPWIIYKKQDGQRWALGLEGGQPALRYVSDDNVVQLDLSKPEAFRHLSQIWPPQSP